MRRLRAVPRGVPDRGRNRLAAAPLVRSFAMMGASCMLQPWPCSRSSSRSCSSPCQRAIETVIQWLTALIPPSKLLSSWNLFLPTWVGSRALPGSSQRAAATSRHHDVFIVTSLRRVPAPLLRTGRPAHLPPADQGLFKQRYPFFKRDRRSKETMAAVGPRTPDFYIVNTRFHQTSLLGAPGASPGPPGRPDRHGTAHMSVGGGPRRRRHLQAWPHPLRQKHVTSTMGSRAAATSGCAACNQSLEA